MGALIKNFNRRQTPTNFLPFFRRQFPFRPQPFQPPQIENMPQIIPTDLMNRFPFIPFQPPFFNDFNNLDFTIQDFTYTPSNSNITRPTLPRFNYPTDRFGMPQIIPTELYNRMPRLRLL